MKQNGKIATFCLTALLVLALSQLSSYLVDSRLAVGDTYIVNAFLHITHVRNIGGTFGLFPGHGFIFAGLSVVIMIVCSIAFLNSKPTHWIQAMLFGFIIGGGAANVADRLIRGSVVDFINVQGIPHWQYIFNTADVFIHLGIWPTLLIGFLYARKEDASRAG
jgi:signal peptidase II